MNTDIPLNARGYHTRGAALYTSLSESFLKKARRGLTKTAGTRFKKIGKRVVYVREDLDAFLEQSEQDENLDQSEQTA